MRNQKGFALIEVSISIVLVSLVVIGVLFGLGTASQTTAITNRLETAKNIAEAQMEYVKSMPYSGSYSPASLSAEYAGYEVAINSEALMASNIEKITVTVSQNEQVISVLEGYKVQ